MGDPVLARFLKSLDQFVKDFDPRPLRTPFGVLRKGLGGFLARALRIQAPRHPGWSGLVALLCVLFILLDIARFFVLPQAYQVAISDYFEAAVVLLGTVMCGFAAVRSAALPRGLWAMTAAYFLLNAAADFHDFLVDLHISGASFLPTLELLGWCTYLPLALLIFFPAPEGGKLKWRWLPIIDFAQVAIALALAYSMLIYVPHLNHAQPWTEFGLAEMVRNVAIMTGLLLRSTVEPSAQARAIYRVVGGAFAAITLSKGLFPGYAAVPPAIVRPAAFLAITAFAAYWTNRAHDEPEPRKQPMELPLALSLFAAAPLFIVLALAYDPPPRYRTATQVIAAASALLFLLRIFVAEHSRYTAQRQVRESEREYRLLFEGANVPILIVEPGTERILQANRATCELYAIPRDFLIGASLKNIAKDMVRNMEQIADLLRTGECRQYELVHRSFDGRNIHVVISSSLIQYRGRQAILSFHRDVTAQKQAIEALRLSEERLKLALCVGKIGVFEVDLRSGHGNWTPEIDNIWGTPDDGKISFSEFCWSHTHPEDVARVTAEFELLAESGQEGEMEFRIVRPSGEPRWIRWRGRVLADPRSGQPRCIGVNMDITEHKNTEEQLRQAQKMEAIGRLAGGVAHDFNNLLSVILGNCEILQSCALHGDAAPRAVGRISRAASSAASLTKQLLAFSRRQTLKPVVLNLNEIVAQASELLGHLLRENIKLVLNRDPELGCARADPAQIQQVILNLALNARDAMPQGGILTIETRNVDPDDVAAAFSGPVGTGRHVMVAVTDTGVGMNAETRSHLFEPFFTCKAQGTGLGLAAVHGIVEQSGGCIAVTSAPGCGTTMRVFLPHVEAQPEGSAPAPEQLAMPRAKETILLVEDDADLREVGRAFLEAAGYAVLEAGSCEEAVEEATKHAGPIHLLLTDVVLPTGDGKEVAAHLQSLRPDIATLFMSGYNQDLAAPDAGPESHSVLLQKPFSRSQLLSLVRATLDCQKAITANCRG